MMTWRHWQRLALVSLLAVSCSGCFTARALFVSREKSAYPEGSPILMSGVVVFGGATFAGTVATLAPVADQFPNDDLLYYSGIGLWAIYSAALIGLDVACAEGIYWIKEQISPRRRRHRVDPAREGGRVIIYEDQDRGWQVK